MCLIFIALKQHPEYKLIIAANRDEFYNRKTAAADFWTDQTNILAGRDLEAGGTWLGISTSGKISMITNFRDLKHIRSNAPSRGHLVSEYLASTIPADEYMKGIEPKASVYNGFNLLAGTVDEFYYLSNYANGVKHLTQGLYGLSNHLLETPWPKVRRGKEKFESLLKGKNITKASLFNLLFDDTLAPDASLPDTGVGIERERILSSMFIKSPGYGTRCSTVILVDQSDSISFTERVYDLSTFDFSEKTFELKVS